MPRTSMSNRFLVRDMGTCLNFDGVDDLVSFSDSSSLDFTNSFTITAWIYPRSFGLGSLGRIVDKVGTTAYMFSLRSETGLRTLQVLLDNTQYTATTNSIRLGMWQHVAVTFDKDLGSNQIKFYVNGVAQGVATRTSAITANATQLTIGNRVAADRTFNGMQDEIKMFNTGLTATQIQNEYLKGSSDGVGLVLYAKFDEGSGTTAIDSSGTQANGTITGATYSTDVALKPRTAVSNRITLIPGTSLVFASGNRVQVKSSGILSGLTNFSITAWIKPTSAAGPTSGQKIYSERNASAGNDIVNFMYSSNANPNTLIFQYRDDAGTLNTIVSNSNSIVGVWRHVAVTKSGTAITFYLNGQIWGTGTLTATNTLTDSKLALIGNDPRDGNSSFVGSIDDVQISTAVLTQAQIIAGMTRQTVASSVGRWKFDEGSGTSAIDSTGTQTPGTITGATYSTNVPFGVRTLIT